MTKQQTLTHQQRLQRLQPNGGQLLFEEVHKQIADAQQGNAGLQARFNVYRAVSLINSAMRERAEDHKRSTERLETSKASAVSAVVKPAK